MTEDRIQLPQMLMIGATGRNIGKTTLAMEFVKHWKDQFPIIGLKVTTIQERDGKCPRGGVGCGICSSLKGNFELLEETNPKLNKDTSLLLASGAEKVYWLKALKPYIYEGMRRFLALTHRNALIICESNSLRNIIEPGVFLILEDQGAGPVKKSAAEVKHKADMVVDNDMRRNLYHIVSQVKVSRTQAGPVISLG